MGSLSIWHWLIVALVIMLLFGKGRISEMMGDLGKGIKSFKRGIAEEEEDAAAAAAERKSLPRGKEAAVHGDAAGEPVREAEPAVQPRNQ